MMKKAYCYFWTGLMILLCLASARAEEPTLASKASKASKNSKIPKNSKASKTIQPKIAKPQAIKPSNQIAQKPAIHSLHYIGGNQKKYILKTSVNHSKNKRPPAINKEAAGRKISKPYAIDGVTYCPAEYDNYEEVGLASWYGNSFGGKTTANGEVYDVDEYTAAHPTLPLPSMVKVTNLDNNKYVVVRINDRGPFSNKRIIDVSEKAADKLGFKSKGVANVKVEYLKDATKILLDQINQEKNDQL
jgi:rare lipoprotein A (peptidoglycan hydrolase)